MSGFQPLLPLCETVVPTMRDGYVGGNAHILLPFYLEGNGYWFVSGQIESGASGLIPQDQSMIVAGDRKPDTFKKDCCTCLTYEDLN